MEIKVSKERVIKVSIDSEPVCYIVLIRSGSFLSVTVEHDGLVSVSEKVPSL